MGKRAEALHPIIRAAAKGDLPDWAVMSETRRLHSERVARLLTKWAKARELGKADRLRWRAAGFLHDALKGVSPKRLRRTYDLDAIWPDPVVHGPAVAARLKADGVKDRALLRAVAYHTIGHKKFDDLGCFLYIADHLDPGRRSGRNRRRALRSRMPDEYDDVLKAVAAAKIGTLLDRRLQIPRVTVEFWDGVVAGR